MEHSSVKTEASSANSPSDSVSKATTESITKTIVVIDDDDCAIKTVADNDSVTDIVCHNPVEATSTLSFPGLVMYLLPGWEIRPQQAVMTLFYSCAQCNLKISIDSVPWQGRWTSCVFIESQHVSTDHTSKDLADSQACAVKAAVHRLNKNHTISTKLPKIWRNIFQGFRNFLPVNHTISGLVLYFKNPSQPDDQWLDVLQNSCNLCHLSLTWWHHDKSPIWGNSKKYAAVLMIDSKPISCGNGWNLEKAKSKAAISAILTLQLLQPISYEEDDIGLKGRITQTSSICPAEQTVNELKDQFKSVRNRLAPVIPNFKLFLPHSDSSMEASVLLLNSLIKSQTSFRLETVFRPSKDYYYYATKLIIQDIVVAVSYETSLKQAYHSVWVNALAAFKKTEQVEYGSQYGVQKKIQGLSINLPHPGSNCKGDPRTIIEENVSRCKKEVQIKSMLNKTRSQYASKVLIDDIIVAWGYGKTLKCAHKNVWKKALQVLKREYPVYYQKKPSLEDLDFQPAQVVETNKTELVASSVSSETSSCSLNNTELNESSQEVSSPSSMCDRNEVDVPVTDRPFDVLWTWRSTRIRKHYISKEAVSRYITSYIQKDHQESPITPSGIGL